MIGKPGSTLWLLGAEIRLGWRDTFARRGARRGLVIGGLLFTVAFGTGLAVGWTLRHVQVSVSNQAVVIVGIVCTMIFSLMLSQTLAASTQALYARGDLDLLFSAPIAPRKVLAVRFAAIAFNIFAAFAVLIAPALVPIAIFGHPAWLGAILVLAALALTASALGLLLAVALFRLIGPRRTRTVAQILAAIIGAAFFIASQTGNIIGGNRVGLWLKLMAATKVSGFRLPPGADWPLRAAMGDPLPLAAIVLGSVALFIAVSQGLGARFAADSSAAAGADVGGPVKARTNVVFASGAFAATFAKEMRLLRRDAALLSQVFLRVLYLLPVAFILVRNAGSHMTYLLPGGAAALGLMAGQVSGSLAWVTVSAEDAPDLLAASPTPIGTLMHAKLAAALAPVAILLAVPLLVLIVMAPAVGLAATIGCAASAVASALINAWHNKPAKRADFRRRRSGSWLGALAQTGVTMLIAIATALLSLGSLISLAAIVPALLAAGAMLLLRRSDAQLAESLRAAS